MRVPLQEAPLPRAQEVQDPPPRTPNRRRDEPPPHIEELDYDEPVRFPSDQDRIRQPGRAPPRQREAIRGHYFVPQQERREPFLRQGRVFVGEEEEEDEFGRMPIRHHYHPQPPKNDFKIKIDLSSYSVIMDTEVFLEWLESVESTLK